MNHDTCCNVPTEDRRPNERYAANCVQEVERFGSGSVMVWACTSYSGRKDLIRVQDNSTARRYLDEIIRSHVLPFMNRQIVIFQRDNARPEQQE